MCSGPFIPYGGIHTSLTTLVPTYVQPNATQRLDLLIIISISFYLTTPSQLCNSINLSMSGKGNFKRRGVGRCTV